MKTAKKSTVSAYLPDELRERIEALAGKTRWSLSTTIVSLLEIGLAEAEGVAISVPRLMNQSSTLPATAEIPPLPPVAPTPAPTPTLPEWPAWLPPPPPKV